MKTETLLTLAVLGLGGYLAYRWWQSTQVPANVLAAEANPAAARNAAFGMPTYPGITPMPAVPSFNITDPLGLGASTP